MFLWYLVNSNNYFQHSLNMLMLFISVIMTFFIMTVIHSIFYVYMYIVTVHYMGIKKNKAEIFAFVFSCLALLLMGYPSLSLLYLHCTSVFFPDMCINVLGNQWYWLFDYSSYFDDSITMYMSNLDSLVVGDSRFLEVDNRLVLPVGGSINFLITSSDVIHGFNLPSVGVKYDALPGILTVVPLKVFNMGTYVGQCSEICGAGHAFMPIVVEASSAVAFQQILLEMHVQLAPANPVVSVPSFSSPTVKSFLTRFGETYDAHHESPFWFGCLEHIALGAGMGVIWAFGAAHHEGGIYTMLFCGLASLVFIKSLAVISDTATAVLYTIWPFS